MEAKPQGGDLRPLPTDLLSHIKNEITSFLYGILVKNTVTILYEEVTVVKQPKLTITFHNPNTTEELAAELVKIAAEVAAEKVRQEILHSETVFEEPSEEQEIRLMM